VTSTTESLEALVEILADPAVVVDASGRVRQANPTAEHLLGWGRGELAGQSVEVLVPEGLRAAHVRHRGEYGSRPESRQMVPGREIGAVRRDGSEIGVEISLS
jgi:PAS domain S-box-containing protein